MKKTALILLLSVYGIVNAQNVSLQWGQNVGGLTADVGQSIVVDASGNTYTTGSFKGTADFDPGSGSTNLTSNGDVDIFILKLNASGNLIWAKSIGGTGYDYSSLITIDATGNLYITGNFSGSVDFDPNSGTTNLTSIGSTDAFIVKLSSSGNFVFAKQFGGTNTARSTTIKVDVSGNIYTAGNFIGTIDFDPGSGTANLSSTGLADAFISKLDGSGNFIWAKNFGGTSGTNVNSISVDASGNIFVTGSFDGTSDFDPGSGTTNFTAAWGGDTYISKLDASGNLVWAKQMVGNAYGGGNAITIDASGNIYTTGWFNGGVDFDPGAGTYNLSSGGAAFISKLDGSGSFVWAKHFNAPNGWSYCSSGNALSLDASSNIYLTGWFKDTADFDPGTSVYNLISNGMSSIYVSKLDASGNFIWAQRMGGYNNSSGGQGDQGNSIAVYNTDNIYVTGNFQSTSDFDPGTGVYNLTSAGEEDVFIAKLCQNAPAQPTITPSGPTTICQGSNVTLTSSAASGYSWSTGSTNQSITVNTAGNYSVTVSNSNGCSATSAVVSINVLPVPMFSYTTSGMTASFSLTGSNCSSFLWDFGNGNTSSINPSPIVTYAASATYNVCLQCTGNTCVSCLPVTVPGTSSGGIGIKEQYINSDISIYPNPANGNFTIETGSGSKQTVDLYDVNGKHVFSKNVSDKENINVTTLNEGVYSLTIKTAGRVINKKLVILR